MRNEFFQAEDACQKRRKMRDIIRHRVKDISKAHLELVLDAIDYERQYYVKIMRNPQKFKNIVVNEFVQTPEESTQSESFHIYGNFTSGIYTRAEGKLVSEPSELEDRIPAAALKHIKIASAQGVRSLHEIVIYQPMQKVCNM